MRLCVQRLVGVGKRPESKKARVLGSLWRTSGWDSELSLLREWVPGQGTKISLSFTHTHTKGKTPHQQMVQLIELEDAAVFFASPNV